MEGKIYVYLIIAVLFGICLSMPFKGVADTIVGYNNWTHDTDNNIIQPTNTSVDVGGNNNSLKWFNLSTMAGDNLSWDPVAMAFDVTGSGFDFWNDDGTTLFPRVDGRDVQVNGTITGVDGEFTDDLDVGDRLDVGGDIVVVDDVSCDALNARIISVESSVYHDGDPDTFFHFGTDELYFMIDGFKVLELLNATSTFFNNVIMSRNLTVTDVVTAGSFVGDGSGLTNVNASNISGGLWNRSDGILYTGTDDDGVQVNGSDGDILINNSNITSTGNLTVSSSNDTYVYGENNTYVGKTGNPIWLDNHVNVLSGYNVNGNGSAAYFNTLTMNSDAKIPGCCIVAEEGAALSTATGGGLQFSYGNGAIGNHGIRQITAGTVVGMSINVDTDTATINTGQVDIAVNGVAAGGEYHVHNPGAADGGSYAAFATPLSFNAGDRLTFITTTTPTGGSTTDVLMCMWVTYT